MAHPFFEETDRKAIIRQLGPEVLFKCYREMLLIRQFEIRGETAYQQGKVGGFFHSYIGQEAIQTAAVRAFGPNNWYTTTYRCHALALLLGATPNELMAELFGRSTGNAKGRGGSMHFYTERLLGGFGIVGGHIPIATGAAFTIKYLDKQEASLCFLGDGAVAQGAFHEALNMAALWNLPCIYVIENNLWGMGTPIEKAVSVKRLAADKAPGYNMKSYTFDGQDFFHCYSGFSQVHKEVLATKKPVLIEVITERFKGHSISDPGLYRSKDSLKKVMERDPLIIMHNELLDAGILTPELAEKFEQEVRKIVLEALEYAEKSPWPDTCTLEEDVFAPNKT